MCVMPGKFADRVKVEKTKKEKEIKGSAMLTYFKPVDINGVLSAVNNFTMTII